MGINYIEFVNRMHKFPRMYDILGTKANHSCPHHIGDRFKNKFCRKYSFIDKYHFDRYCHSSSEYHKRHPLFRMYWRLHENMKKRSGS